MHKTSYNDPKEANASLERKGHIFGVATVSDHHFIALGWNTRSTQCYCSSKIQQKMVGPRERFSRSYMFRSNHTMERAIDFCVHSSSQSSHQFFFVHQRAVCISNNVNTAAASLHKFISGSPSMSNQLSSMKAFNHRFLGYACDNCLCQDERRRSLEFHNIETRQLTAAFDVTSLCQNT